MVMRPGRLTAFRERFPLTQALRGVGLAAAGTLLLSVAVNSMSLGRPVTHAWVIGVAGTMLLVAGVVVAAHAVFSAFCADPSKDQRPNGPPPLKFT